MGGKQGVTRIVRILRDGRRFYDLDIRLANHQKREEDQEERGQTRNETVTHLLARPYSRPACEPPCTRAADRPRR